jgi:hypothetical protein
MDRLFLLTIPHKHCNWRHQKKGLTRELEERILHRARRRKPSYPLVSQPIWLSRAPALRQGKGSYTVETKPGNYLKEAE